MEWLLQRTDYEKVAELEHRQLEDVLIYMPTDEWFTTNDPKRLLTMLRPLHHAVDPDERYRELACACCRRMWEKPKIYNEDGFDYPTTAHKVLDALRIGEDFCVGKVSHEELRRAHEAVKKFEESAISEYAHANMRLGDSTTLGDVQSAFYDAYPATAVRIATSPDIAETIIECIGAAAKVVAGAWERQLPGRQAEERLQAEMIRCRWLYPEAVAANRLEALRFRQFRDDFMQQLFDDCWGVLELFGRMIKGRAHHELMLLYSNQMRALVAILSAEELRDNLLTHWMNPNGGPYWSPRPGANMSNQQLMDMYYDLLNSDSSESVERQSHILFFYKLIATAYAPLKGLTAHEQVLFAGPISVEPGKEWCASFTRWSNYRAARISGKIVVLCGGNICLQVRKERSSLYTSGECPSVDVSIDLSEPGHYTLVFPNWVSPSVTKVVSGTISLAHWGVKFEQNAADQGAAIDYSAPRRFSASYQEMRALFQQTFSQLEHMLSHRLF